MKPLTDHRIAQLLKERRLMELTPAEVRLLRTLVEAALIAARFKATARIHGMVASAEQVLEKALQQLREGAP